jgi:hypothetical protein
LSGSAKYQEDAKGKASQFSLNRWPLKLLIVEYLEEIFRIPQFMQL